VRKETDKNWAALVATMMARIESEGVGSPTHEKAITDALNTIDGVQEGASRMELSTSRTILCKPPRKKSKSRSMRVEIA